MAPAVARRTIAVALGVGALFLGAGVWVLDLQGKQARDTTRKLNLEDLETALNRILSRTGTLPPADAPTWCGVLRAPKNTSVREAIERALRETGKYAKPEKPFPADPRFQGTDRDYAYWKTSPVSFELLSELEADPNNSRPLDLERCELITDEAGPARNASRSDAGGYDYAIVSVQRRPL